MDMDAFTNYSTTSIENINEDIDCDCIPDNDDKVIRFNESSNTFTP
jgi:hypothetical protein